MKQLVEELAQLFLQKKQYLALAESCTGGQISAAITAQPGVSAFYRGAVVAYSGEIKKALLNVAESDIAEFGEVSETVAKGMALGAQKNLLSDWSVSVTGIAGPDGGTVEKPVGTVCFAFAGPDFVETTKQLFSGTRDEIQKESVEFALKGLLQRLKR